MQSEKSFDRLAAVALVAALAAATVFAFAAPKQAAPRTETAADGRDFDMDAVLEDLFGEDVDVSELTQEEIDEKLSEVLGDMTPPDGMQMPDGMPDGAGGGRGGFGGFPGGRKSENTMKRAS